MSSKKLHPILTNPKSNNSGFNAIADNGQLKSHDISTGKLAKSGYLYVYCSNQSNLDLFFDNLQVIHNRGQILEENHYYPFGLVMASISGKAGNFGMPENKFKYNGIEFETDLDLLVYDAFYRELDPQTGKWWEIDPKTEEYLAFSPYTSNNNNPISFSDSLGDEPNCCGNFFEDIGEGFVESAKGTWNAITNPIQTVKSSFSSEALANNALNVVTLFIYDDVKTLVNDGPGKFIGAKAFDAVVTIATDGIAKNIRIKPKEKLVSQPKGLGNPFKNVSLKQIEKAFEKHVESGKLIKKPSAPGNKAFQNKKSKYSYNLDPGSLGRKGKKEHPHVDVNYPNPKPSNRPPKKKFKTLN